MNTQVFVSRKIKRFAVYKIPATLVHWLAWNIRGRPHLDCYSFGKRARLARLGRIFGCETFVETGTYLGDTVAAMRRHFSHVVSIELSPDLYNNAKRRFADCENVELFEGDSGQIMPNIVARIEGKALFWLDGHYSGGMTACGDAECPVIAELLAIANAPRNDHVIIIDDARFFGKDPAYPTLCEVETLLQKINSDYSIEVVADAICAYPPEKENKSPARMR